MRNPAETGHPIGSIPATASSNCYATSCSARRRGTPVRRWSQKLSRPPRSITNRSLRSRHLHQGMDGTRLDTSTRSVPTPNNTLQSEHAARKAGRLDMTLARWIDSRSVASDEIWGYSRHPKESASTNGLYYRRSAACSVYSASGGWQWDRDGAARKKINGCPVGGAPNLITTRASLDPTLDGPAGSKWRVFFQLFRSTPEIARYRGIMNLAVPPSLAHGIGVLASVDSAGFDVDGQAASHQLLEHRVRSTESLWAL